MDKLKQMADRVRLLAEIWDRFRIARVEVNTDVVNLVLEKAIFEVEKHLGTAEGEVIKELQKLKTKVMGDIGAWNEKQRK